MKPTQKIQSKNRCPNCGSTSWYPLDLGTLPTDTLSPIDLDYVTYNSRLFLVKHILVVDDADAYITNAIDVCARCNIALTIYTKEVK